MRVESVSLSEADMVDFAAACESEKNITTQQAIEKKNSHSIGRRGNVAVPFRED
jgi:hypothetical protein